MSVPLPPCDHDGCPKSRCKADLIRELVLLKAQVEQAIQLIESGNVKFLGTSAPESFAIGDFVIRRRK